MNIPRTIIVGANQIIIKRDNFHHEADQDGGSFEWETNTMFIADNMPEDREATCFLHEILHAVNIYLDEVTVTAISEGLMQVIRDNNLDFRKRSK